MCISSTASYHSPERQGHKDLVLDVLYPAPKIINTRYLWEFNLDKEILDYRLELRRNQDEVIDINGCLFCL